jgi:ABC-type antimicrobial peptide transport system permease subunit
VSKGSFAFVSYRLRASRSRGATKHLSLVVLVALLGGLAIASVAGARRTDSSFPTYLASTNPSTVAVFTRYVTLGLPTGYDPAVARAVAHLPLVERSTTAIIFDANINLEGVKGIHPHVAPGESPPTFIGSPNGEFSSVDRVTLIRGRIFRNNANDEAIINVQTARETGAHVGSVVSLPFFTDAQILSSSNDTKPSRIVTVRVVGEFVASRNVVESDIDSLGASAVIFSPGLTRELSLHYATGTETYLQVRGGDRNAKRVLGEVFKVDPVAQHLPSEVTSDFVPTAQQAISPQAVALAIFGAIAGLAAFLIGALIIGRSVRLGAAEIRVLRALGASRSMLLGDELVGLFAALITGSFLAVVAAVLLSPLTPLGPVRPVYPNPGFAFDWTVLGFGLLALVGVFCSLAVILARREIRRATRDGPIQLERDESMIVRAAARLGLPISAMMGLRFALDPGRGRNITPVRSALLGATLAVTVLTATVTFGTSLDSLVSQPALYGWNWNYAIVSAFGGAEDLPAPQIASILHKDHDVLAWSGANFVHATLDHQREPVYTERPGARVSPTLLSGHDVEGSNQVVLGVSTMAELHKRLGDTVTLGGDGGAPRTLVIVGTATIPAVSSDAGLGQGAIVATSDFSAALLNLQGNPVSGPNMVLVRVRSGVSATSAYRSLKNVVNEVDAIPKLEMPAGGVIKVLRPAEIVNFRSMGTTPAVLAGLLALGTVTALGLSLTASVRRRRRDLALLMTLGFKRRQLAFSVAWQATVCAVVGCVIGLPLGIVIGRELWDLFARSIDVVPHPTVSALSLTYVGVGALLFSNIVAAIPGRIASRTSTALVLRAE